MDKKFYEKTWFIVLMLILFFPVGLVLVWTNKQWSQKGKIIATVIVAVVLLLGLLGNGGNGTSTPDTTSENAAETTVETTAETSSTDAAADIPTVIENSLRARITDKYTSTDIDKIVINENLGTDTPDDYIALVYLTWNVQNSGETSKDVLTLYSNDLASMTAEQLTNVQEIAIFWEVPYLNDSAKCSYERNGDAMYVSDTVWGNGFSK